MRQGNNTRGIRYPPHTISSIVRSKNKRNSNKDAEQNKKEPTTTSFLFRKSCYLQYIVVQVQGEKELGVCFCNVLRKIKKWLRLHVLRIYLVYTYARTKTNTQCSRCIGFDR